MPKREIGRHGGHRGELAVALVELHQLADVDVDQAVAVGHQEVSPSMYFSILRMRPPVMQSEAGVGQGDAEVLLGVSAVIPDAATSARGRW